MPQMEPIIDTHMQPAAPVVLDANGVRTWHAMRETLAWFELRDMHWTSFEGDKAVDALNGLLTNDVASLQNHCSFYAAALTPKGKVVADMFVLRESDRVLFAGVSSRAFDGWWQIVRKYINPRLAKYRDERGQFVTFACCGPRAQVVLMAALEKWEHRRTRVSGLEVRIGRIPAYGRVDNWFIVAPVVMRETLRAFFAEHTPEGHPAALEVSRVEAGRPAFGVDMDENTLAQEANMEELDAISFEKGCYTGQETVARVHFRGHVNRQLRGLRSDTVLTPGSVLQNSEGKVVGEVKSSALSPTWGAIAIAMVRREVPSGAVLTTDASTATVCALPFGSDVDQVA